MACKEVSSVEISEVIRRWRAGRKASDTPPQGRGCPGIPSPLTAVAEEAEHTHCLLCFMPPQPWRTRPPTFSATACPDNELRAQMRDPGLPTAQEGLPGGAAAAGDRESRPACGVPPPGLRPAGPRQPRPVRPGHPTGMAGAGDGQGDPEVGRIRCTPEMPQ